MESLSQLHVNKDETLQPSVNPSTSRQDPEPSEPDKYEAQGSGTHNKCKNNSIRSQTVSYETSEKFYGELKIGSLNVCGLKSRVQYPEFVELLNQYDVLCVSETKLDNADVISVQGYTFYSQPRKQKYIRKSGGLGFFVRDNLTKLSPYSNQLLSILHG